MELFSMRYENLHDFHCFLSKESRRYPLRGFINTRSYTGFHANYWYS